MDSKNYFGRYLMSFEFNEIRMAESVRKKPGFDEINLSHELGSLKTKYRSKLPFKVTLSRDLDKDKEDLKIEEILDVEGENIPVGFFRLFPKTMESDEGYWLDTGEFQLSIAN